MVLLWNKVRPSLHFLCPTLPVHLHYHTFTSPHSIPLFNPNSPLSKPVLKGQYGAVDTIRHVILAVKISAYATLSWDKMQSQFLQLFMRRFTPMHHMGV